MDVAVAIDTAALKPYLLDQAGKTSVILGPVAHRRAQPGIEATMLHQQHAAHHAHPEKAPVRFDEGVLYLASLAKYAVAFFRMSRSSVTRASSAFSRRISAASAASCRICRSGL